MKEKKRRGEGALKNRALVAGAGLFLLSFTVAFASGKLTIFSEDNEVEAATRTCPTNSSQISSTSTTVTCRTEASATSKSVAISNAVSVSGVAIGGGGGGGGAITMTIILSEKHAGGGGGGGGGYISGSFANIENATTATVAAASARAGMDCHADTSSHYSCDNVYNGNSMGDGVYIFPASYSGNNSRVSVGSSYIQADGGAGGEGAGAQLYGNPAFGGGGSGGRNFL
jgi:hypothetical protein